MWGGLGALGLGLVILLAAAMGGFGRRDKESLDTHISAYTRNGAARQARARADRNGDAPGSASVAGTAVGAAQRALDANKGLEASLGTRLDGAGLALKPAEWLLLHAGITVGLALLAFLATSGGLLLTLLALAAGGLGPWLYLGIRKARRLRAFNGQLPETLQLVAGSISAGLSLSQALDSVVREGSEPIAGEFRRAIVETRLGVQVEDALESVAHRMESDDFEWVVMAIRIQREVGGNLSELLLKVSGTMREREYLRRQVKTLSAEGRLSGWILGALPPGMLAYLLVVNPDYLSPMISTPLGWLMLGGAAFLMAVGAFWMSRVVKVEV
jgi:tight adherence protein B